MLKTISLILIGHDLKRNSSGLGPNSWGYWRIVFPFARRFYEPSKHHDCAYTKGVEDNDKEVADTKFHTSCLNDSGKDLVAKGFSIIYFKAVRKFGHLYFNYKKNDNKKE